MTGAQGVDLRMLPGPQRAWACSSASKNRVAAPLIDPAIFRDLRLCGGLAMSALVSTVMMASQVLGPFYLAEGFGLSGAQRGLALSLGPLVSALPASTHRA